MSLVLVQNVLFSFLMWPSSSLAISFGTFDFAFKVALSSLEALEALLLSILLFLVPGPSFSCCTYFVNKGAPLDSYWLIVSFSLSYFVVSSVSSALFLKFLFGSSEITRRKSACFDSFSYLRPPDTSIIWLHSCYITFSQKL